MKITDVTVTLFAWDGLPERQFGRHTGRMAGGRSELGLVTISTDEGVQGHSFLGSSSRGANFDVASLIKFLKPLLIGEDPLNRERIYQRMWPRNRNTTLRCIGAVDVALRDLGGKVAGLPIHRMLGSFRDAVPAYASSEVLPSREAYADEALRIQAAGFHAYKMHPPAVWQTDIDICEHVRRVVGDDYRLMLDSTWSCNFEVLLPNATQKYGLAEDLSVDNKGMVRVPDGPGLGAKIDFDLIAKKQTAVLS